MPTMDISRTPLLSTSALRVAIENDGLHLLDASWYHPSLNEDAPAHHTKARLPGARRFDIDAVAAGDGSLPHMLPDAEGFAKAAGALGIGPEDPVVVYDQTGIASAACRTWWTFRCFGHENVAVLDGGLPAWRSADLPLATGEEAPAAPVRREAVGARLEVWNLDRVRGNIEGAERLLLDARSTGRFRGIEPEPWGDPGHVPASANLPYGDLLDPDTGLMLPVDELARRFDAAGAAADRPLVLSCGSGVTACVLALALRLLGRPEAALYDGSWSEWVSTPGTPRTPN